MKQRRCSPPPRPSPPRGGSRKECINETEEKVQAGCVENLDHHKKHDVVGEDDQAEFTALIVVSAGVDVTALAAFDH